MHRLETAGVACALALLLVGLSVRLLTVPVFTSIVARAVDSPARSDLAEETALGLAEQVRGYVTGADPGPLPGHVEDRVGFTPEAVSHLDDVRAVLTTAAWATWILLGAVGIWLVWSMRTGRRESIVRALRAAGWTAIGVVPLAAAVALGDFDAFFEAFHGLFFASGTWQFSSSDLLIQLFPEPFWMTGAAAWGVLVVCGGGLLLAASRVVRAQSWGSGSV